MVYGLGAAEKWSSAAWWQRGLVPVVVVVPIVVLPLPLPRVVVVVVVSDPHPVAPAVVAVVPFPLIAVLLPLPRPAVVAIVTPPLAGWDWGWVRGSRDGHEADGHDRQRCCDRNLCE